MKKIYNSPEIDIIEMVSLSLLTGSIDDITSDPVTVIPSEETTDDDFTTW